ncbi:MAG: 30S ribosomal protein S6 [Deltaproteobacteria bacterium]|nr:30S ribosomal protein S6 [Deltaproteobacteria bacterium]
MREYETLYVLKAITPEKEVQEFADRLSKMIQQFDGEILFTRPWGKRGLAFLMEKEKEGIYTHIDYVGNTELVAELERNLRLDERVLRFMTILLQDNVDPAKRKQELIDQAEAAALAALQPAVAVG